MSVSPSYTSRSENGVAASNDRDLASELSRKEGEIAHLLEETKKIQREKEVLEDSLQQILQSRSWRITGYFRKLAKLVRALFPLLRWRPHVCHLRSGRNTEVVGGTISVQGPSPTTFIGSERGRLPRGWVRIQAKISSEQFPIFFLLYYGDRGSFNPVNRAWLTFAEPSSAPQVFRIPEWATELRLDPFNVEFPVHFESLTIQEIGKLQVVWDILVRQLRAVIWHPPLLWRKLSKLWALLREGGFAGLRIRLFANDYTSNYQEWVKQYDTLGDADREKIRTHLETLSYQPKISVVMPVYNTPERWLRLAIESVTGQLYGNWELCIADDASTEPHVRAVLGEFEQRDHRIKVRYCTENGHISAASNAALELAHGEFVALLDHDDELTPDALYQVVARLNKDRELNLIYSDEDKITTYGMRFNPYFKSDWNPELFLVQNFICHLGVYRTEVVRAVGGFREGFEGAQDWDLALRVIEQSGAEKIAHIPHVLYHWRVIEGSTAQATAFKPYVLDAQARAVREHLSRRGLSAHTEILPAISHLRVTFEVPTPPPLVSIIIPTKDQLKVLARCVESIRTKTTYAPYELIIVDNGSEEEATHRYLDLLRTQPGIAVLRDERPFNFSRLNNDAVKIAKGSVLAFCNNDLEVIAPGWLEAMVGLAVQPDIGAVGARLLFPNHLVQHAGVILGIGGVAGHNHKGRPRHDPGYFNRCILTQSLSAVTAACMVIRREVFESAGMFDEQELAVAFNDVDLCLKVRAGGKRVVYCAEAELFHHESVSRGYEDTPKKFVRFEREIEVMKSRWREVLARDPYYNPNLTLLTEDFTFAFPPRCEKPWRVS